MTKKEQEEQLARNTLVADEFWPEGVEVPGQKIIHVMDAVDKTHAVIKSKDPVAAVVDQDWQSLSRTLGLELYERQPEETDNEWLLVKNNGIIFTSFLVI